MKKQNLFHNIPGSLPEELLQTLAGSAQVHIERIVSRGHRSPDDFWYDQEQHEFVLLVQGEAELEFQNPPERLSLLAGDWLVIPARRRHRVVRTDMHQDTVWLAVFY